MRAKGNKIEIECNIWNRYMVKPYPIGILELVGAKMDYVGTAIRQRHQIESKVPVATMQAIDYVGSNKAQAENAFRRLVREINELGGSGTSREETWYYKGIRYQSLKADLVLGRVLGDVVLERISEKDVYKRSRALLREAKKLEQKLTAEAVAKPKPRKRPVAGKAVRSNKKNDPPALTALPAPRLVRKS